MEKSFYKAKRNSREKSFYKAKRNSSARRGGSIKGDLLAFKQVINS